MNAKNP